MTQAPTPGPLSVGDRVVAIADLRQAPNGAVWIKEGEEALIVREFGVNGCLVGVLTDDGHEGEWAKTCFRLAPTAPVEASGSERETVFDGEAHDLVQTAQALAIAIERVPDWLMNDNLLTAHCHAEVLIADLPDALHPQPSGETRESIHDAARRLFAKEYPGRDYDLIGASARVGWMESAWEEREALLSARPLALGGQQGEEAAWSWLNRHVECDPADRDYSADEMVDAFMAGAGRYDIWAKALERIAGEQQHRSGYCQTDITVEPALTAEEAQTVARDALSTTPARAEAQDEGAAGEPVAWLVQGKGKRDRLVNARQYNPTKPDYWISAEAMAEHTITPLYAHPSPTPAADADAERVRIAVEALEASKRADEAKDHADDLADRSVSEGWDNDPTGSLHVSGAYQRAREQSKESVRLRDEALAALKSTAAKEGGK